MSRVCELTYFKFTYLKSICIFAITLPTGPTPFKGREVRLVAFSERGIQLQLEYKCS